LSRLLGIDLGARRIGLAAGDSHTGASRPLATIRRDTPEADAERIGRILTEQKIDEIVLGLPLNMDGTEGTQALATREWAAAVEPLLGAPIRWRDERLTSVRSEAERGPARRGSSGGPPSASARRERRATVDRDAARLLVDMEIRARGGLGAERTRPPAASTSSGSRP
jgi:putative Holliday junction resolvase